MKKIFIIVFVFCFGVLTYGQEATIYKKSGAVLKFEKIRNFLSSKVYNNIFYLSELPTGCSGTMEIPVKSVAKIKVLKTNVTDDCGNKYKNLIEVTLNSGTKYKGMKTSEFSKISGVDSDGIKHVANLRDIDYIIVKKDAY